MGKLATFTFLSLNGFYKGDNEDISWHQHGGEEGAYSSESLESESILLLGRITYEMMKSFWPTEAAYQAFPTVAEGMNSSEKIVFSKTLEHADWNNTRIIKNKIIDEVARLKRGKKDMTLLGSGSIWAQLAAANLVDEYKFMIDPVILDRGVSLFQQVDQLQNLKLVEQRTFKSGIVLLCYKPLI